MALFVAVAFTVALSGTLTLTSATGASALCSSTGCEGNWRSKPVDSRLTSIDVWPGGGCHLYAEAWRRCEKDPTMECSLGSRELQATPAKNFRFFYYNWSDRNQVLQVTLRTDKAHLSIWDHTDFNDGRQVSFTVLMVKR
ncbi:hypothetical protein [Streptomyces anandii]|uniref:hypothetical protein n=1 Tax=Streptomyces anandii TaxID=285454 RepID=UPI0037AE2B53